MAQSTEISLNIPNEAGLSGLTLFPVHPAEALNAADGLRRGGRGSESKGIRPYQNALVRSFTPWAVVCCASDDDRVPGTPIAAGAGQRADVGVRLPRLQKSRRVLGIP